MPNNIVFNKKSQGEFLFISVWRLVITILNHAVSYYIKSSLNFLFKSHLERVSSLFLSLSF